MSDEAPDDIFFEFDRMLLNPGNAHIIHNATNALKRGMGSYELRTTQLKAVCNLCRTNRHKPRLLATCFGDAVGTELQNFFDGFQDLSSPGAALLGEPPPCSWLPIKRGDPIPKNAVVA